MSDHGPCGVVPVVQPNGYYQPVQPVMNSQHSQGGNLGDLIWVIGCWRIIMPFLKIIQSLTRSSCHILSKKACFYSQLSLSDIFDYASRSLSHQVCLVTVVVTQSEPPSQPVSISCVIKLSYNCKWKLKCFSAACENNSITIYFYECIFCAIFPSAFISGQISYDQLGVMPDGMQAASTSKSSSPPNDFNPICPHCGRFISQYKVFCNLT